MPDLVISAVPFKPFTAGTCPSNSVLQAAGRKLITPPPALVAASFSRRSRRAGTKVFGRTVPAGDCRNAAAGALLFAGGNHKAMRFLTGSSNKQSAIIELSAGLPCLHRPALQPAANHQSHGRIRRRLGTNLAAFFRSIALLASCFCRRTGWQL